jgi:hypothetical protein
MTNPAPLSNLTIVAPANPNEDIVIFANQYVFVCFDELIVDDALKQRGADMTRAEG